LLNDLLWKLPKLTLFTKVLENPNHCTSPRFNPIKKGPEMNNPQANNFDKGS